MNAEYASFLASKALRATERGLKHVPELAAHLFPFQSECVDFSLRVGSSGCYLDTGLGKTEVQLEWSQKVIESTNKPALILTPLAVAAQTKRRADRWGYEARVIREQSQVGKGINIINYDRLNKIDPSSFGSISLDEASVLKSFMGKTTRALIEMFKGAQFRLCATATPAPNDHIELGNYAEFLGVMSAQEMLSRFFINDTSVASQEWRLKGHAVIAFWDWIASWARMAEKPSDLTNNAVDDVDFVLPPFETIRHMARSSYRDRGIDFFNAPQLSATTLHEVKRMTIEARAEMAASIVDGDKLVPWIIWVDTDYESDAVKKAIPEAIEVRGSQTVDEKENRLLEFETGAKKYLIAKPSMCGFGLDWSHCARMLFVGRSFSYETWYQAVRRCWRFGQRRKVKVHLVVAEGENEIGRVILRKSGDHAKMKEAMRYAMLRAAGKTSVVREIYNPTQFARVPEWLNSVV